MALPVANSKAGMYKVTAIWETLDIRLAQRVVVGKYMGFGMVIDRVIGEQQKQFIVVERVRKGGVAEAGHVLEGDVLVAVNGSNVAFMDLRQVREMIMRSKQVVLTVSSFSTFRLYERYREKLLQMAPTETLKVQVFRRTTCCESAAYYGFETFELRTSNDAKETIRCHVILKVQNPQVVTPGKAIYPNDILLAIGDVSVGKMNTAQVKAEMARGSRSQLSITIVPISLLRVTRPPLVQCNNEKHSDDK
ncbi:uncharacterized protein LOC135369022 isoform X2 [Ornithodoros turicata]|uniref:uncharacterized protein LOC135369022 isoform X2 n=1 Tax=Ornithodoros turicata TaxID=34597 RepID=UPI003139192B